MTARLGSAVPYSELLPEYTVQRYPPVALQRMHRIEQRCAAEVTWASHVGFKRATYAFLRARFSSCRYTGSTGTV